MSSPSLTSDSRALPGGGGSPSQADARLFEGYRGTVGFDELFSAMVSPTATVGRWRRGSEADHWPSSAAPVERRPGVHQPGITFSVYSDLRGVEKIFPFEPDPRPVSAAEWRGSEAGLRQRVEALNLFLYDVYQTPDPSRGSGPRRAGLGVGDVPPEMVGFEPPGGSISRRGHRPDPRDARAVPRPGGQRADAVRGELRSWKTGW